MPNLAWPPRNFSHGAHHLPTTISRRGPRPIGSSGGTTPGALSPSGRAAGRTPCRTSCERRQILAFTAFPVAHWAFPRSIPARAGEPCSGRTGGIPAGVYPRACGGTRPASATTSLTGSIPARAGEPRVSAINAAALSVYPRACGGTTSTAEASLSATGLSPRVRGNRAAELAAPA